MFRARALRPSSWVDLFVRAGARYVVPVAEHCDGFAMYDSDMTPWNAAAMGPHRDVVGELATARAPAVCASASPRTSPNTGGGTAWAAPSPPMCARDARATARACSTAPRGHEPSRPEWRRGRHAPDAKEPDPSHLEQWLPPNQAWLDDWLARSTELVDKYHPDFFYFDWWIGQPAYKPDLQQFAAYYYDRSAQRNQQPVLTYKEEDMPANTATLDIERGKLDTLRLLPWQTDTSISIHSWGYVEHDEYRTAESLVQQLIDTVAKNGNLLLNVGPKSDGTIPDEARTVLLQIGDWLQRQRRSHLRHASIHASSAKARPRRRGTQRKRTRHPDLHRPRHPLHTSQRPSPAAHHLYATALGWPTDGKLILKTLYTGNPYLTSPICSVDLLGSTQALTYQQHPYGLDITLPTTAPNDIASVFRIRSCPPAAAATPAPSKPHHKKKRRVHHDDEDDVDCCNHIG